MSTLHDRILEADDIGFEDLSIDEWGGVKVRVRGLSGHNRDAYEAQAVALRNQGQDVELRLADFRTRLVVKCLFDPETDERIFTDGEVARLAGKSSVVIQRLFKTAQRLSGMDDEAVPRAEGNSEPDQSDSSTTD